MFYNVTQLVAIRKEQRLRCALRGAMERLASL